MGSQDFHGELVRKLISDMLVNTGLMKKKSDAAALFENQKFGVAANAILGNLIHRDYISGSKINDREIEKALESTNEKIRKVSEKTLSKNASDVVGKVLNNVKTKTTAIGKRLAEVNLSTLQADDIFNVCDDVVKERFPQEFISAFEEKFNECAKKIDGKTLDKLVSRNLLKKLFSVWMVSLCTIASMPDCSGGEDGLFGLTFTL